MFSKLITPPREPRKAQLSDFLKPVSRFFGDITPPCPSTIQSSVEPVSFTPSPTATQKTSTAPDPCIQVTVVVVMSHVIPVSLLIIITKRREFPKVVKELLKNVSQTLNMF